MVTAYHTNTPDPVSYNQAVSRPDSDLWLESIKKELDNPDRMNVWTEVVLPAGEKAIGTTWAFRTKTNENDILIKQKSRLCAQGYAQRESIDYNETYAPTDRLATF